MRSAFAGLALIVLTAPVAAAQGAGTFTQVGADYRWSRGTATFDLKGRDAPWSAAEADAVRQCLDMLPDVLLRKVASVKVDTFYRDVKPRGLTGQPRNASATTVIERGFVAFGDVLFGATPDVMRVYSTVTHELGHCAQYAVLGNGPILGKLRAGFIGTPNWTGISFTMPLTDGLKSWNGFVSDYARTNDREDFAESVEFYWLAPDELLRVSPAKFAYMRDVVFEKVVSPSTSRRPGLAAITPVKPDITKLGDTKDDPLSLVKVTGTYFMGPLDGGFNKVRYRGARALHLPISRSTVWSWVPTIAKGPADVTLETQDGTSDPEPFEVAKPWWKFW
jgi:hypothetical protein